MRRSKTATRAAVVLGFMAFVGLAGATKPQSALSIEQLKNGTYLIDGQPITLVEGQSESELLPGSASRQVTSYLGNPVNLDLNSDGWLDSAFLLVQETGGSGTFYFVAAALQTEQGLLGTNAVFLGDRIAPQSTVTDPNNPSQLIVNYTDRRPDEPMSAVPTQPVAKTFKLANDTLVEVSPQAFDSPEPPYTVAQLRSWHETLNPWPWPYQPAQEVNLRDSGNPQLLLCFLGGARSGSYALFTSVDGDWSLIGEIDQAHHPIKRLAYTVSGWHDFQTLIPLWGSGGHEVLVIHYRWNGDSYQEIERTEGMWSDYLSG